MNKKITLRNAIYFGIILVILTSGITLFVSQRYFNSMVSFVKERENMYTKLAQVDNEIRAKYYGEIDEQKIIDETAKGFVNGACDKYSKYLTKEEYKEKTNEYVGEKIGAGLGVRLQQDGYYTVEKVYENSAAMVSGIKEEDIIIKVNGKDIVQSAKEDEEYSVFKELQGEVGTKVNITVKRDNGELEFTLKRKKFDIISVSDKMIDTVAYIHVSEFSVNTYDQFAESVNNAVSNGAKGIIIDLRNNGGGALSSCYKMIDMIVPEGEIASSVNSKGEKKVLATSDKSEIDLPIVILTNENTASASELFTSALLDFNKAVTVGTKTYGKGIMQSMIPLDDGSAVNLTTAGFVPPSGESFHGIGIPATYEVEVTDEQRAQFAMDDEKNDPQLIKALEVVRDKDVFNDK